MGFLGIVPVHGMRNPQSVACFRYAHVEGVPPPPAVRLHQDPVSSATVGRTRGFDKVVQEAETPDDPALAVTRRDDHDNAMLAASHKDPL